MGTISGGTQILAFTGTISSSMKLLQLIIIAFRRWNLVQTIHLL